MIRKQRRLALFMAIWMVFSIVAPLGEALGAGAQPSFGQVLDERSMEIGPGANYSWYDMKLAQGLEKVHAIEFDPKNPALDLQPGKTDGKVYGMTGVTKMADDADKEGNRVIAAINGDFYDMSTGVPLGLFMGDGEILTSPPAPTDWLAFGLKQDGSTVYGLSPVLKRTLAIGAKTVNISHINRMRENSEALMLYTSSFHTSTMTNDLGDEVVLDVLEGEVKSGQSLRLKVSGIHKDKGNTPLEPGKVVLSASGKYRAELANVQIGDELTASFELEDKWKDVKMAIGGVFMLVEDGVAKTHEDKALYPRVGIGTKADGSIVMVEIDGRAPGFSEGVSYDDLGKIMKDMGVVNALCLDGGGSSTFVAKLPGETKRKILNRPSDGGERKTANGLLLVNKMPEGPAVKLVVQPNMERVLVGSSVAFKSAAVDANGHPAALDGTPVWTVNPALGAIDGTGTFTAGSASGTADITVTAGSLSGRGKVEVIEELTELKLPDAVKTLASGQSFKLSVAALRDGQAVRADNAKFEWRTEGPIGSIDANGVYTATGETEKNGKIYVKYKNVETSMDVNVGLPPVILEDFENGVGQYMTTSGARFKSVKLSEETNEDFVRFGNKAAKLEYDFTEQVGTSGAYITATDLSTNIQIPGYPEKISAWVYGDGKKHWLRGQIRDGNGSAVGIDFVDQTIGVDFTGWRYMEAVVPKGRPLPLRMDQPIRYMETKNDNKTDGVLYIDQIRAVYGPTKDDMDAPVLKDITPAEGSTVHTGTPKIQAFGEDFGYDPAAHPGTTLIDPDKIRFYVDGVLVPHTLYPPKGQIHYTPNVPLADGVHQAKIKISDLSGNRTEKVWTFNVDTGSSKLAYESPEKVYAGNTYSLALKAVKASNIRDGHIEFGFDLSKVEGLQVIKGDKLAEHQLTSAVDAVSGVVRVQFSDIGQAGLTDQDTLGQIRFRVKSDAAGTLSSAFRSGSIRFLDKGDTQFGFFGLPAVATIQNHLKLAWDEHGIVEGMATTFKVTDESGAPVEGASIRHAAGTEIGVTNAAGVLQTSSLTAEVKEYRLQAAKGAMYSAIEKFKVSKLAGSPVPSNISVTMGADPTVSRAFTWHTNPATEGTVVEVAKKSEFTDFNQANVVKFTGGSYLFNTWDTGTVRVHKAAAIGLEPGTAYVYRVGNGAGSYSPQGSFQTAAATGERTKFLFLGDSQATNEPGFKLWGDILKKAMADHPDAEFVVQGGDLVEDGFKENEWNMWFGAAQEQLMQTTVVPVVGNHEVTGTRKNDDFLAHFNHPQNGVDSLKGTNFSFDYKNAHFVVLNSEYDFEQQKEWLRNDLANTDKQWKLVAFHRGPYGSIYDSEHIRTVWTPIFDEFNVDLVMNGHDHIYLRTYPLKGNEIVPDGEGTTYIVGGSSGPKFYQVVERSWHKVTDDENVQMYVAGEIDGNEMRFVVKTINDRVVDQFTLMKIPPESVEIDKPKVSLTVGESVKLHASVMPSHAFNKSVTWSVYNASSEGIVSVGTDGLVTAHGLGQATVRAQSVIDSVYADSIVTVDKLQTVNVDEVRLDLTEGQLKVGGTLQLNATVLPADASDKTVIWSVYGAAPTGAASVSADGLVTAMKPGTAVIRALSKYDATKFADFKLTVEEEDKPTEPQVSEVRLEKTELELKAGEARQLKVTVLPEQVSNKSVIWSVLGTDSEAVANVTENGLITALRPGIAKIRATSVMDPEKYGELILTVKQSDVPSEPQVEKVKLNHTEGKLKVGGTLQLNATVLPADASDKTVTWSVYSDSPIGVATVSANGLVTALKPGTAVIRATSNANATIYADFTLTVKEEKPEEPQVDEVRLNHKEGKLKVGGTQKLIAVVLPGNVSDKTVTWSVYSASSAGVASVSADGLVTAMKPGTAVIRALSKYDATKFADFKLTVEEDQKPVQPPTENEKPETVQPPKKPETPDAPKVEKGNVTVTVKPDASNATAKAAIDADTLALALKEATVGASGAKKVRIDVKSDSNAMQLEISLPAQALAQSKPDSIFEIVSAQAVVTLPSQFLQDDASAKSAQSFSLVIGTADKGSLPQDVRERIGDRPVIDLEIKVDGVSRAWSNPDAPVQVAIPYKPSAKEQENPNGIVIWYIDGAGKAVAVPNGKYDKMTGTVRFTVTHFSRYAVAFVNKTFADIGDHVWAKAAIEALAVREVIQGTGADTFAPAANITRADFVTLLVRTMELKASFSESFGDVMKGDHYYDALGTAKQLGIVIGSGANTFKPKEAISRQDLFTIAARALTAANVQADAGRAPHVSFADSGKIAEYAVQSVSELAKLGLIEGDGGRLNPEGNATRAETAVFMERLLKVLHP
ncbi:Ig-like domain-containing protein [Paenibacillus sp. MBLB4367]|uniref:Ig-like domain-containing protein n=1 Tax=Paenibacillus sp. MBLB4367 TaxID=3384767 RepID=UPI0039082A6E